MAQRSIVSYSSVYTMIKCRSWLNL